MRKNCAQQPENQCVKLDQNLLPSSHTGWNDGFAQYCASTSVQNKEHKHCTIKSHLIDLKQNSNSRTNKCKTKNYPTLMQNWITIDCLK